MKIYKAPNEIFDTENPASKEIRYIPHDQRTPLHHTHTENDRDFLLRYFVPGHEIFNRLTESFYYKINQDGL